MNNVTFLQLNQRLATLRQHVEQISDAAEFGFVSFVDGTRTVYECGECQSDSGPDPKALTHAKNCLHGSYQRALNELAAIEQLIADTTSPVPPANSLTPLHVSCLERTLELLYSTNERHITCGDIKRQLVSEFGQKTVDEVEKGLASDEPRDAMLDHSTAINRNPEAFEDQL